MQKPTAQTQFQDLSNLGTNTTVTDYNPLQNVTQTTHSTRIIKSNTKQKYFYTQQFTNGLKLV